MAMTGKFITLEGGEGSGKTTLLARLLPWLEEKGIKAIASREPGGCRLSEKIRDILLDDDPQCTIGAKAELLLYLASRVQHLEQVIKPSIEKGTWVLCDRFNDSSVAYQGFSRGLGIDFVETISDHLFQSYAPLLTLYLDIDPVLGLKRSNKFTDNQVQDRIEKESLSFHQKVREGYLKIAEKHPNRVTTIDATLNEEELFNQAKLAIEKSVHIQWA
jgi:dTMP kinase